MYKHADVLQDIAKNSRIGVKRCSEPHEPAEYRHLYPKHDGAGSGCVAGAKPVCDAGRARGSEDPGAAGCSLVDNLLLPRRYGVGGVTV